MGHVLLKYRQKHETDFMWLLFSLCIKFFIT